MQKLLREHAKATEILRHNHNIMSSFNYLEMIGKEEALDLVNFIKENKIDIFELNNLYENMIENGMFLETEEDIQAIISEGKISNDVYVELVNEGFFSDPLEMLFGFGPIVLDVIGAGLTAAGVTAPVGAGVAAASRGLSLVGCLYYTIKMKEAYDAGDWGAGFGAGLGLLFSAMAAGIPLGGSAAAAAGKGLLSIIKSTFGGLRASSSALKLGKAGAEVSEVGAKVASNGKIFTSLKTLTGGAGKLVVKLLNKIVELVDKLKVIPMSKYVIEPFKTAVNFVSKHIDDIAQRAIDFGKLTNIAKAGGKYTDEQIGTISSFLANPTLRNSDEAVEFLLKDPALVKIITKLESPALKPLISKTAAISTPVKALDSLVGRSIVVTDDLAATWLKSVGDKLPVGATIKISGKGRDRVVKVFDESGQLIPKVGLRGDIDDLAIMLTKASQKGTGKVAEIGKLSAAATKYYQRFEKIFRGSIVKANNWMKNWLKNPKNSRVFMQFEGQTVSGSLKGSKYVFQGLDDAGNIIVQTNVKTVKKAITRGKNTGQTRSTSAVVPGVMREVTLSPAQFMAGIGRPFMKTATTGQTELQAFTKYLFTIYPQKQAMTNIGRASSTAFIGAGVEQPNPELVAEKREIRLLNTILFESKIKRVRLKKQKLINLID